MEIKDLFVPYELAKLAKEKGFNELSNYFYTQKGELKPRILTSGDEPMNFEPEDFFENFNTIVKYEVNGVYQSVITAPLWQQLVDWFRETHFIWIKLEPSINEKTEAFIADTNRGGWTYIDHFDRPSEALAAALTKAFELI